MKQTIVLIAIVISVLTSCNHGPAALPVNIIVLLDFSPSRDTSVLECYRDWIQHSILEKMRPKEKLVVLPLDFNSETSSEELFKVDFSKNDYTNEFAGLQKDEIERQNHLDSVHSAARQFCTRFETVKHSRSTLIAGTDIFGALKQTRKYIAAGHKNIIVIFSDMLEYTDKDKWNFEDHLNNCDEIEHYISTAEKIDLQDIQIVVLTGAQNSMRPEKFKVIETFWEKYFLQCHAVLADYSSGAVTKLEEVISQ